MKTHSEAFLRKRRSLLVLPLLVLPFLTMAFWSLGGGKGTAARAPQAVKGLNLHLPEPQLHKEESSKLSLYQQARRRLQKSQDPGTKGFLHRLGLEAGEEESTGDAWDSYAPGSPTVAPSSTALGFDPTRQDPNEEKINERLARLSHLVSQKNDGPAVKQKAATGTAAGKSGESRFSQDVARLETMMRTMSGGNSGGVANPEMQQLEGMLERILDIQHPERVKEKLLGKSLENPQQVFAVQAASVGPSVTFLHQAPSPYSNGSAPGAIPLPDAPAQQDQAQDIFYSLYLSNSPHMQEHLQEQQGNSLQAAVHETQSLLTGATVKLRLLQDIYLAGRLVPQGSLLYGTCQIRGERLSIGVSSIRSGNALLPVSLVAYDLDGIEGLYIPGALARDAARQGAGRAISQSLQFPALSPSLGAQAMGAGIDAARGLLSKQARQVKVTVKAGHLLLLRDQQTKP